MRLLPFLLVEYESVFQVGYKGISDGIVEATLGDRKNFLGFWRAYFKPLRIDPYLEEVDFQTKTRVATGFAGRVRKGSHGLEKQVQVGTVCAALRGINMKISLDTGRQPLHQPWSNDKYILPLQHMSKGFENKDPPQVKNIAVHSDLPDWLQKWVHRKGSLSRNQEMVDLEMVAFYYLLRVGGYTSPKRQGRQPITQKFSLNDVRFFKLSKTCGLLSPLPLNTSKQELLLAMVSTLSTTEQNFFSREHVCIMDHWKEKYFYVQ